MWFERYKYCWRRRNMCCGQNRIQPHLIHSFSESIYTDSIEHSECNQKPIVAVDSMWCREVVTLFSKRFNHGDISVKSNEHGSDTLIRINRKLETSVHYELLTVYQSSIPEQFGLKSILSFSNAANCFITAASYTVDSETSLCWTCE